MKSKKLTISKLMHGYKFFEAKNGNSFVETELFLFAANFAIDNLFV